MCLISGFWSFWRTRILSFSSLDCWWDEGKREIRRLSIDFCKRRAAVKRMERDLLTRLADFLKQRIDAGAMFCFGPYQTVLSNLAKLDLYAACSAQIRSRTRWVEEGESSSSYFFRLVTKQSADRLVSALHLPDGSIVNSSQDLVDCFADFYSLLFSAEEVDPLAQHELLSKVSARLSVEQSASCEGALSVGECFAALQGMAHWKAPGNDGLPMEFSVKFWDVLGSDLGRVLNFCFGNKLSKSQRREICPEMHALAKMAEMAINRQNRQTINKNSNEMTKRPFAKWRFWRKWQKWQLIAKLYNKQKFK